MSFSVLVTSQLCPRSSSYVIGNWLSSHDGTSAFRWDDVRVVTSNASFIRRTIAHPNDCKLTKVEKERLAQQLGGCLTIHCPWLLGYSRRSLVRHSHHVDLRLTRLKLRWTSPGAWTNTMNIVFFFAKHAVCSPERISNLIDKGPRLGDKTPHWGCYAT